MRPYRFSDELIGIKAIKDPNKTDRHLLDKGIGLQQSIAQLFRGLLRNTQEWRT